MCRKICLFFLLPDFQTFFFWSLPLGWFSFKCFVDNSAHTLNIHCVFTLTWLILIGCRNFCQFINYTVFSSNISPFLVYKHINHVSLSTPLHKLLVSLTPLPDGRSQGSQSIAHRTPPLSLIHPPSLSSSPLPSISHSRGQFCHPVAVCAFDVSVWRVWWSMLVWSKPVIGCDRTSRHQVWVVITRVWTNGSWWGFALFSPRF